MFSVETLEEAPDEVCLSPPKNTIPPTTDFLEVPPLNVDDPLERSECVPANRLCAGSYNCSVQNVSSSITDHHTQPSVLVKNFIGNRTPITPSESFLEGSYEQEESVEDSKNCSLADKDEISDICSPGNYSQPCLLEGGTLAVIEDIVEELIDRAVSSKYISQSVKDGGRRALKRMDAISKLGLMSIENNPDLSVEFNVLDAAHKSTPNRPSSYPSVFDCNVTGLESPCVHTDPDITICDYPYHLPNHLQPHMRPCRHLRDPNIPIYDNSNVFPVETPSYSLQPIEPKVSSRLCSVPSMDCDSSSRSPILALHPPPPLPGRPSLKSGSSVFMINKHRKFSLDEMESSPRKASRISLISPAPYRATPPPPPTTSLQKDLKEATEAAKKVLMASNIFSGRNLLAWLTSALRESGPGLLASPEAAVVLGYVMVAV